MIDGGIVDRPSTLNSYWSRAWWLEQLAGRRQGHAFNKVTAVSATGFSLGAIAMANKMDVELRQVQALEPKAFGGWMAATYIQQVERAANLTGATFLIGKHEPEERRLAVDKYLKSSPDTPWLVQALTGNRVRPEDAFAGLVDAEGLFNGMTAGQPPKRVRIEATYTSHEDFFYVDTELGYIKIETIQYAGELSIKETMVPIFGHSEYASADGKEVFAQVAKARHVLSDGRAIGLSFHKMGAEGETLVSIQVEPKEAVRRIGGGTAE